MGKYKKELKKLKKQKEKNLKRLQERKQTSAVRGMIIKEKQLLENIDKALSKRFKKIQKDLIEYLFRKGYSLVKSRDFIQPQFKKSFSHKQVRVAINNKGIMILLDPEAGKQLSNNGMFINPNAKRIDYSYKHRVDNLLNFFYASIREGEKRANSKRYDDKKIKEMKKSIGLA